MINENYYLLIMINENYYCVISTVVPVHMCRFIIIIIIFIIIEIVIIQ